MPLCAWACKAWHQRCTVCCVIQPSPAVKVSRLPWRADTCAGRAFGCQLMRSWRCASPGSSNMCGQSAQSDGQRTLSVLQNACGGGGGICSCSSKRVVRTRDSLGRIVCNCMRLRSGMQPCVLACQGAWRSTGVISGRGRHASLAPPPRPLPSLLAIYSLLCGLPRHHTGFPVPICTICRTWSVFELHFMPAFRPG